MASTTRRLQDWSLTFFGLGVVVSGMAAIDETSRQYLFNALHGEFPPVPAALRYHAIAGHVAELFPVVDSSFVAFGVVALVLMIVMFRM